MLSFLCNSVEGLRVEQKWLLVHLMNTYVRRGAIWDSAAQLVKTYSVSSYVVRAVVNGFLVREGVLIPERGDLDRFPGQQKRGRPQLNYKLDRGRLEERLKIGVVEGGSARFEKLISELLLGGLELELSKAQQLLLAVLLAYANELGVVENLGQANLRRLVGMGASQLRAQIKQLVDEGYILRVLPGGVSAKFFGRQSSLYVLDVEGLAEKLGVNMKSYLPLMLAVDSIANTWFNELYKKVSKVCVREQEIKGWRRIVGNPSLNDEQKSKRKRILVDGIKGIKRDWLLIFDAYYPVGVSTDLKLSEVRSLFRGLFSGDMHRNKRLLTRKLTGYVGLYLSKRYTDGADINQCKVIARERIKEDLVPEEDESEAKEQASRRERRMCVALAGIACGWTEILALEYERNCKELQKFIDKKDKSSVAVAIIPGEGEPDRILVSPAHEM